MKGLSHEIGGTFNLPIDFLVIDASKSFAETSYFEIERSMLERRPHAKHLGVGRIRILVGKPGLDGHSNAAEQVAVRFIARRSPISPK